MFEILVNRELPEFIVHMKVLQSQEKFINLEGNKDIQREQRNCAHNRVKLSYSEEWKIINDDRELIKATDTGFLLYLQLTDRLNIKLQIKPKIVNFLALNNEAAKPFSLYNNLKQNIYPDYNLDPQLEIPQEERAYNVITPQNRILQNNTMMLENQVNIEYLSSENQKSLNNQGFVIGSNKNIHSNVNLLKKVINRDDNVIAQYLKIFLMNPDNNQTQKFKKSGLLNTTLTKNLNQRNDASFLQKNTIFENFQNLETYKKNKSKKVSKAKIFITDTVKQNFAISDDQKCCICYCKLFFIKYINWIIAGDDIEVLGVLECGHKFCYNCIIDWAKVSNHCPLCKKKFNKVFRINSTNLKALSSQQTLQLEEGQNCEVTVINDVEVKPEEDHIDQCKFFYF